MTPTSIEYTCDECNTTGIVGRGEDGEPCPETSECSVVGCGATFCQWCEEGEHYFRCDQCGSLLCRDHRAMVNGEPVCAVCIPELELDGPVWVEYRSNLTGRPVKVSYASLAQALHSLRYAGVDTKAIIAIDYMEVA